MLENTSDSFGTVLKQLRKRQRLTQHQLAEALGVHRNTIGRWEEGSFLPESKALVLDLARCLHLDEQEARQLLDASLSAPMPLWSVPSPRNPFFTGRETMLATLYAHLGPGQQVALTQSYALHGLGGIGKTQLALEYAYRYVLAYRAIFWIGAETVEQIHAGLLRIAERLGLPECKETEQQRIAAAVQRWLETHGQWLLIWDNLEEPELMQRYLPTNRPGAVLITTRSHALGTIAQGIDLAPLEEEEGILFLLRRTNLLETGSTGEQVRHLAMTRPTEYAAASALVTALGRLPLALDQAGAYIEETQCGLADFLTLLQQYPLQVLQERGTHAEHPASVVKTFVLSFEKLHQNHRAAAELLTACCFLAPEDIPESLFARHALLLFPEYQKELASPLAFHKVLKSLLAYALMQRHPGRQTLAVHRLVQAVLKAQLSDEQQHEWLARLINLLAHAFPQDVKAVEAWPWCEQLLPHALHCLNQTEARDHAESEALCLLLIRVADYLYQRAQYARAEELYQRALGLQTQAQNSQEIPSCLVDTFIGLADVKQRQGLYSEAGLFYQRGLSLLDQSPSPDISQRVTLLRGLSNLYFRQGCYQEAEPLYQQVLSLREQLLGPDHPLVASSLDNLAMLYTTQGQYAEAELLLQRALSIHERIHGKEHLKLAPSLNNLAMLYFYQGRYQEAEVLWQQVILIHEKIQLPGHPDLASPLINLAELTAKQGRRKEAEAFYLRACTILEQVNTKHPELGYTLLGLGDLYVSLGKYQEAEALLRRVADIWEQTSSENPNMAHLFYSQAHLLFHRGKYTEAQDYCQCALARWRQTFGSAHIEVAKALHLSGLLWLAQNQHMQAEQVFREALAIRLTLLGETHPETVETRMHLAHLFQELEHAEDGLFPAMSESEPLTAKKLYTSQQESIG